MKQINVGVVGCGNISDIYFTNLTKLFSFITVKGCCDLYKEKAIEKQKEYNLEKTYGDLDEMLNDPEIHIALILTQPPYHYEVCVKALEAGKHVYVEKPLSITKQEGEKIKALASAKNLFAGGAPDTFLGAGIQTCRSLIEEGWIGKPIAACANMMCHGHEGWHPDPEFYYQVGGGPMFDMGPYYLTALINLLGPVKSVSGSCIKAFEQRTITSEKKFGNKIDVEVPTHITGILNFKSGAVGTIVTSFDVWKHNMPHIEIYGTLGSISVPDPNTFGGIIKYQKKGGEWFDIPHTFEYSENSRGLGVADMALAILNEDTPRANIDLTYHVLDIMQSIHEASDSKKTLDLESTCMQPKIMDRFGSL